MDKAEHAEIRISHTERNEAVSTLGVHLSTGRLQLADFEERCGQAATALTRGDLEALFTDLPAPHPDLSSAIPPARSPEKAERDRPVEFVETPLSSALGIVAGLSFIVGIPAAVLLTIFQGMWWLFIPVGLVLIVSAAWSEGARKPKF